MVNTRLNRKLKHNYFGVLNAVIREFAEAIDEEINREERVWVREWVREWLQRRNSLGATSLLLKELAEEDHLEYKQCLRMTPENFEQLLNMVKDKIQREDTMMRDAIKAEVKLQVTLNFLATGNSYRSLSHFFRVSIPSISKFIPEMCDAISEFLADSMKMPAGDDCKIVEDGFDKQWNFPHCCGAIDGKHILIKAPPNSGSEYFNYKGQNSIVLMALVDHEYCFTYINVGFKGSNADGGVFKNCALYEKLENNLLPAGRVIVGDDAFPLTKYLMKPYNRQRSIPLTITKQVYNYRLSRARRVSENAFGILVSRFRVFERTLAVKLTTVNKIVQAACTLHNWLTKTCKRSYLPHGSIDYESETREIITGQWRQEITELRNIERYDGKKSSDMAKKMREKFTHYFNNEGTVAWQYKNVF